MRYFLLATVLFFSLASFSQGNKIYNARYLQTPPVFPFGIDSCQRFYLSHYKAMDSILYKVVTNGDTANYIRIYFSFVVDQYGSIYDARFEKITSTLYAKGVTGRLLKYFAKGYYDRMIKEMILQMPLWRPALLNGVPVMCKVNEYLQCWVGINPPEN